MRSSHPKDYILSRDLCSCTRNNQSLKGAVVVTLCQNEADVKWFPIREKGPIRFGGQFPLEIILLPHSDRGLRKLLLSIPERSVWALRVLSVCPSVQVTREVARITGRHLFHTCRNAIMAIQCLELLYITLFAWILGNNVLYYWFGGAKNNHLCLWQDTEISTGCPGDKYGIAFDRDYWQNFPLLLHCYWYRWTIHLLEEVRPVGFRMATSSSVYRLWEKNLILDQGSHRSGSKVTWVKVKGHMQQGQPKGCDTGRFV